MIINIAGNVDERGHIQFDSCSQIYSCGQSPRTAPAILVTKVKREECFLLSCLSRDHIILGKLPHRSLGSQGSFISYYLVKHFLCTFYLFFLNVNLSCLLRNKSTLFPLTKHRNMRRNEVQRPKPGNCQWEDCPLNTLNIAIKQMFCEQCSNILLFCNLLNTKDNIR